MRENRTSGTAWGVPGDWHSYHNELWKKNTSNSICPNLCSKNRVIRKCRHLDTFLDLLVGGLASLVSILCLLYARSVGNRDARLV